MTYIDYTEDYRSDTMSNIFSGKIKLEDYSTSSQLKRVELGHGKSVGCMYGSYNKYIENLSLQTNKKNDNISIGKSISIDKGIPFITNMTDKFIIGDTPHILITYYNIINHIRIKVMWKDSDNDQISEQYYDIPSAYSMQYYWWDLYSIYFIGPENLKAGNYKVEIVSTEFKRVNDKKILSSLLEFTIKV